MSTGTAVPSSATTNTSNHYNSLTNPTEHKEVILTFAARHRILTTQDLQRMFPQTFPYEKKAKRALESLVDLPRTKFLKCYPAYRRGVPDVFGITQRGLDECRKFPAFFDQGIIPRSYRQPRGTRIEHELSITGDAVRKYEAIKRRQGTIVAEGRFSLVGNVTPNAAEAQIFTDLVPDYWYVNKNSRGELILRCEEHTVGEASGTNMRQKMLEYYAWGKRPEVREFLIDLYTKHGAQNPEPNGRAEFELHFVLESKDNWASDDDKERVCLTQTFFVPPEMQQRVWTVTRERIKAAENSGMGINEPMWYRAKYLTDLHAAFEQLGSTRARKVFMLDWMREADTYPLFT